MVVQRSCRFYVRKCSVCSYVKWLYTIGYYKRYIGYGVTGKIVENSETQKLHKLPIAEARGSWPLRSWPSIQACTCNKSRRNNYYNIESSRQTTATTRNNRFTHKMTTIIDAGPPAFRRGLRCLVGAVLVQSCRAAAVSSEMYHAGGQNTIRTGDGRLAEVFQTRRRRTATRLVRKTRSQIERRERREDLAVTPGRRVNRRTDATRAKRSLTTRRSCCRLVGGGGSSPRGLAF